jgi:hypothetical protein
MLMIFDQWILRSFALKKEKKRKKEKKKGANEYNANFNNH